MQWQVAGCCVHGPEFATLLQWLAGSMVAVMIPMAARDWVVVSPDLKNILGNSKFRKNRNFASWLSQFESLG